MKLKYDIYTKQENETITIETTKFNIEIYWNDKIYLDRNKGAYLGEKIEPVDILFNLSLKEKLLEGLQRLKYGFSSCEMTKEELGIMIATREFYKEKIISRVLDVIAEIEKVYNSFNEVFFNLDFSDKGKALRFINYSKSNYKKLPEELKEDEDIFFYYSKGWLQHNPLPKKVLKNVESLKTFLNINHSDYVDLNGEFISDEFIDYLIEGRIDMKIKTNCNKTQYL